MTGKWLFPLPEKAAAWPVRRWQDGAGKCALAQRGGDGHAMPHPVIFAEVHNGGASGGLLTGCSVLEDLEECSLRHGNGSPTSPCSSAQFHCGSANVSLSCC
ncbi:hypothetical protein SKAU_G00400870 [Synaphobranchus kaupii]|uniref:Uncharacterized protein n=1 Tax=Synaphobranchus kaupii TaxID=118154 RepID=A0A9Q1E938_SYNKA|nr:hypothetical protein SKAU_G00400870 [Synaphobranchus kaupii]